jgi:hypothetical protein
VIVAAGSTPIDARSDDGALLVGITTSRSAVPRIVSCRTKPIGPCRSKLTVITICDSTSEQRSLELKYHPMKQTRSIEVWA